MNFREVYDETGEYRNLVLTIGNVGVPNVQRKLQELQLEPIHNAFKNIFTDEPVKDFIDNNILLNDKSGYKKFVAVEYEKLLDELTSSLNINIDKKKALNAFGEVIENVQAINLLLDRKLTPKKNIKYDGFAESFRLSGKSNYNESTLLFLLYNVLCSLKGLFDEEGEINKHNYLNKLLIDSPVHEILKHLGRGEHEIFSEMTLLNILIECASNLFDVSDVEDEFNITKENKEIKDYLKKEKSKEFLKLINDDFVSTFLRVNFYEGIWYFSKENFEELIDWLTTTALTKNKYSSDSKYLIKVKNIFYLNSYLKQTAENTGYKLEELKEAIIGGDEIENNPT